MIFAGRNRVTSGFKLPDRPTHYGVDVVGDDSQTVRAVVAGRVKFSGTVPKSAGGLTWQWGYYVCIVGADNRSYYYCHMMAGSLRVSTGKMVGVGVPLGTMGNSGYSFGAHTHFEVRNAAGVAIDPTPFAGVRNAKGVYTDNAAVTPQPVPEKPVIENKEKLMKFLQPFGTKNCQCFTAQNVNSVDTSYNGGTLKANMSYPILTDVGSDGTFHWVRIYVAGAARYTVVLDDRCKIVELSTGDAVSACVAQAACAQ